MVMSTMVMMFKMLVTGGVSGGDDGDGGDVESGGDYKLQPASLTNDLTTASKTKPFQNLFVAISSSFSIWLWLVKVMIDVSFLLNVKYALRKLVPTLTNHWCGIKGSSNSYVAFHGYYLLCSYWLFISLLLFVCVFFSCCVLLFVWVLFVCVLFCCCFYVVIL